MKTSCKILKASQFKARTAICSGSSTVVEDRIFKTIKAMEQWIYRNDSDFGRLILNRYALIENQWEVFTTIGKTTITLSELKRIVGYLEDEGLKPSENAK
ncbi:MAG: hypothetical protein LBG80_09415 [Bacteroidales bacterium]|jgi:hypothetical protein|nr:hypothetical protein [Bacteroidales bacterium]